MFPKGSRLPRVVFQGKPVKRARFKYGNVSFFAAPSLLTAVIVSKKVARRAVDRNRLRRRAIHALKRLPESPIGLVFYPTRETLKADFAELVELLANVVGAR